MAKKKNSKKSVKIAPMIENVLPQNIMPVGERIEENKNIYISQPVYKEIHKFTQNKTTNESGGMLIGNVIEEFGKTNIIINGFVEAKYCEATPTTLKFTHETWDYVHKEMNKHFSGQKIVGWIHTHPNFGIFLSEYDKFIQENFFKEEYQIAYVVDPIQDIEGFYFWINGKIEKCKGYYKFDKMGTKIETASEAKNDPTEKKSWFSLKNIIIAILAVCVVFLTFSNISQNKKIDNLQNQQETLAASANQSLGYMQQEIAELQSQVLTLEDQLKKSVDAVNEDDETDQTDDSGDNTSDTTSDNDSKTDDDNITDTADVKNDETTASINDITGDN